MLRSAAEQAGDDLARWRRPRDAAHAVERLLADARDERDPPAGARSWSRSTTAAAAAENDRKLLDKLIDIRSAKADDRDGSATDAAYAAAFREAGIDVAALPPAEAGARIRARPATVAVALAAALDDWAVGAGATNGRRAGAERLARPPAPPTPTHGATGCAPRSTPDEERLGARCERWPARPSRRARRRSASTCWARPCDAGDPRPAEGVLRQAQRRHPGDVWLNYNLARCLEKLARRRRRSATTRRPARSGPRPPTSWPMPWRHKAKRDEAIAVFRELARLRPGNGRHLMCLGRALKSTGPTERPSAALDAAIAALREVIRAETGRRLVASRHLGRPCEPGEAGRGDRRIPEAIRLRPDDASAHVNLGICSASVRGSSTTRSPSSARRSGSSPTTPCPRQPGQCPGPTGEAGGSDRRIPHRIRLEPDSPRSREPRRRPAPPGEAGGGDRRVPYRVRIDPACQRPRAPRHAFAAGEAGSKRSPCTARRSGSSPTMPGPTNNSAGSSMSRGSWPRRSPNTARRSGSSRTKAVPTQGLAMGLLRHRGIGRGDCRISSGVPARAGYAEFLNDPAWELVAVSQPPETRLRDGADARPQGRRADAEGAAYSSTRWRWPSIASATGTSRSPPASGRWPSGKGVDAVRLVLPGNGPLAEGRQGRGPEMVRQGGRLDQGERPQERRAAPVLDGGGGGPRPARTRPPPRPGLPRPRNRNDPGPPTGRTIPALARPAVPRGVVHDVIA